VIFEIGGDGLREEIARDGMYSSVSVVVDSDDISFGLLALKIVSAVLPVRTDFITRATPPRVGMMLLPLQTSNVTHATSSRPSSFPTSTSS
jgi:hypothetical protein